MEVSDRDIDTTGGTDGSLSDSLEASTRNNEELSASEQSNGSDSAEDQSSEGLQVTDEELERKVEEMEAEVRRLRDEEQLMKQMLSSAVTRSQLENRLNFYKFSGLCVSKFTDSKLRVDLTPMLHGKCPGYFSYYVQFRILSDDCFKVEKSQLPSSIRERLHKEQISLNELGRLLDHLRHVCECTEIKMKQFLEAEKDPTRADEDENINASPQHLYYKLEVPV